jgi:hypothetical protein
MSQGVGQRRRKPESREGQRCWTRRKSGWAMAESFGCELHQFCFVTTRLQLVEERSELLVIEFYPC